MANERRRRRRLLIVSALLLGGLLTHSTYAGTGDEPHYLAVAHSLAFDRDLDLSNNYDAGEWITGGVDPGAHVAAGASGAARPVHDIGMPLMMAPYVALVRPLLASVLPFVPASWMDRLRVTPATIYRHALSAGMIALTLCVAWLLFDLLVAIGVRPTHAWWGTLLVVASPPLAIYGILFFSELASALFALVVFRWIVVSDARGAPHWATAGAVAGLLVLVHIRNAGLLVAFLFLAWVIARRRGDVWLGAAFAIGAVVTVSLRTAVTHYLWGTWLATPHARAGEWAGAAGTAAIVGRRLAGLLIDQEYGLLIYAPMFVAVIIAFWRWPSGVRDLRAPLAVAIGAYLVFILLPQTNDHGWTGGWSPAARFWVPAVPFLAIAAVAGLLSAPRALAVAIVAVQVVVSGYFWQNPKNLWNEGDGIAAVCERGGATFCGALPSFVRPADLVTREAP